MKEDESWKGDNNNNHFFSSNSNNSGTSGGRGKAMAKPQQQQQSKTIRPNSQLQRPFNPRDRRYRSCCCHTKSFTFVFGVLEIVIVGFLFVSILPDYNAKVCEMGSPDDLPLPTLADVMRSASNDEQPRNERNEWNGSSQLTMVTVSATSPSATATVDGFFITTSFYAEFFTVVPPMEYYRADNHSANFTSENLGFSILHRVGCALNVAWLGVAIVQLATVNIMFYGIKHLMYRLFLPHLLFRLLCVLFLCALFGILAFSVVADPLPESMTLSGLITLLVLNGGVLAGMLVLIKHELLCCEFVRRSAETGYSVSHTRPIVGPPTISFSDTAAAAVARPFGGGPPPPLLNNGNASATKLPSQQYYQLNVESAAKADMSGSVQSQIKGPTDFVEVSMPYGLSIHQHQLPPPSIRIMDETIPDVLFQYYNSECSNNNISYTSPHLHGQRYYGGYFTGETPSSHQRRSSTQRRGINGNGSGGPFGAQANGLRNGGGTGSISSRASDMMMTSPRSVGGRGTLPPLRHTYRPR